MDPLVGPVHDGLVGPFEIESAIQRLAHTAVLELVAPRVDVPALRPRRRLVWQHLALDSPIAERRKVVACRPEARRELLPKHEALRGETFEGDVAVAVELETQQVEIVPTAHDRQVGTPPVLHPLVFDVAAGLETPDLVAPAAERRLE